MYLSLHMYFAKLISTFVFTTQIVQSLFLNLKFQASSLLLRQYRLVCVGPVRKPLCWFSHDAAHIYVGEWGGSVVEHQTPQQKVRVQTLLLLSMSALVPIELVNGGSIPT